ncbi:MAG: hypothetical protein SCARUB_03114 [Candidatus Scalindua rubra]|uniref:Uncharacterized protein n=1 Tax=Candidatus Scalindua rubra TaxID=1872076 RepID=A0A1E3X7Z8_9BACT|nr:MAG: hypothetical protein SCARUB_03114 [Candidatus Scalindua rubra]
MSWFAILVLSAIIAWEVTDYEIPVDCYDYAIVSGKSIVASLLLALIWVHLFSKATIATFLTTFASIGVVVVVAARTIIVYAIIDELTS